jgi:hypothetical protein
VEKTVDRREGKIGKLEIVRLQVRPDPGAQPARETDGDADLDAAHGGKGDLFAGVKRAHELSERPLVDAPDGSTRGLAVQSLGGLDHLLVQVLGQKQSKLFGAYGHGALIHG